jgi:hypothetical protein
MQRFDHQRTDREVRDEVTVHDVDMDQIGATGFGRSDRRPKRREVCGENRRRDSQTHRLTSSEIASP